VNDISEDTTKSALWMLFRSFRLISHVYIAMDVPKDKKKPIKSRGFAFVSFVDQEDALSAMAELQGHRYDYMILKLE
jgi:translation initiation factor 3 subunit G